MKLNRIIYVLLISIFALALFPSLAYAHQIPDATGFVSDFAGVISAGEKAQLEVLIQDLRETNRTEVAVVTVEYAMEGGEDFDRVGIKYFNEQEIGVKGADNGVLILLATLDREIGVYFPQARGTDEKNRKAKVLAYFPQHDDDIVLLKLIDEK